MVGESGRVDGDAEGEGGGMEQGDEMKWCM